MESRQDSAPPAAACWMSDPEPGSRMSEEARSLTVLIERAVAGDPAAFEQIVIQNERRVLTLAWRMLGGMDEAQDVTQEVFLRAFKYIHRFNVGKPLLPWLMRITVNVCRDVTRKRKIVRNTFAELNEEHAESATSEQTRNAHLELASEQQRDMVRTAIASLPERERAAIVLRDIEGLSTREVSEILGSSEATVRSQIRNARLKIRKAIDRTEDNHHEM